MWKKKIDYNTIFFPSFIVQCMALSFYDTFVWGNDTIR